MQRLSHGRSALGLVALFGATRLLEDTLMATCAAPLAWRAVLAAGAPHLETAAGGASSGTATTLVGRCRKVAVAIGRIVLMGCGRMRRGRCADVGPSAGGKGRRGAHAGGEGRAIREGGVRGLGSREIAIECEAEGAGGVISARARSAVAGVGRVEAWVGGNGLGVGVGLGVRVRVRVQVGVGGPGGPVRGVGRKWGARHGSSAAGGAGERGLRISGGGGGVGDPVTRMGCPGTGSTAPMGRLS